jgi:hypothetical protein
MCETYPLVGFWAVDECGNVWNIVNDREHRCESALYTVTTEKKMLCKGGYGSVQRTEKWVAPAKLK